MFFKTLINFSTFVWNRGNRRSKLAGCPCDTVVGEKSQQAQVECVCVFCQITLFTDFNACLRIYMVV